MDNPTLTSSPTSTNELSWDLPMELMSEVLLRLPVKSLVRFRCVCKAWFVHISSPYFASLHLARYHKSDDEDAPILAFARTDKDEWMLLCGRSYEKITSNDHVNLGYQNDMDPFDEFYPYGNSVNGLVLLAREMDDSYNKKWIIELRLWNPAIRKTHTTSPLCVVENARSVGFGFSRSSNDYKLVAISLKPETLVRVYSLAIRSWRIIAEYNEMCDVLSDGYSLIEGKIHFVKSEGQSSHLVVFDVDSEVFTFIDLPCVAGSESYPVVYQEMIGLLDFDGEKSCYNLWVMENDQEPRSWRKMYTVSLEPARCMLCFKNGELLLLSMKEVELYSIETGRKKHLGEISSYFIDYATLYKESLVLL